MDTIDRRMLLGAAGLVGVAALSKLSQAGPLEPPPGPIDPTGITLEQVADRAARGAEPRTPLPAGFDVTITERGSYFMTGDKSSIVVNASDVTIDLNGFSLGGSGSACITINADRVTIRNGSLRNSEFFATDGVRFGSDGTTVYSDAVLEDLIINVGRVVIQAAGNNLAQRCTLRRVRARSRDSGAQTAGILLGANCTVIGGEFLSGRAALSLGDGAVVSEFVVHSVSSLYGIQVGARSLVRDCRVNAAPGGTGITTGAESLVSRCVVTNCATGVDLGARCLVSECSISRSTSFGLRAGQRLRLERSSVHGTTGGPGVKVDSFDSTIVDCTVNENSGVGIDIIGPAMIDRCHLANNNGAIRFDALTRVSNCHVDFNGAFGISSTSSNTGGTEIRDCTITRHATGISLAQGPGNVVVRCFLSGNTTSISAPIGAAVPTVAGGSAATATNPLASIIF
ncbi:MAG: right-handed parallel beta-helix repeat-containing protein [Phycisphaerales bacterium]|nr:right-handed parallel beta-helix repeat-containing protein [Phycisphaerales bacterium]